jgi:uncharacterized damage-inducible protein DinB
MDLLDELLEAWRYTRDGVIAEAENLPPGRFDERPAGLGRSALDLVNHIVESGWLMAGELSRAGGDFQRASYPDLLAEHTPASDRAEDRESALEALRRSHAAGEALLRDAGIEALRRPIRQFNGVEASRLAWMHHGVAHEEYHRGQLALYARLLGETPALTKLILGQDA